MGPPGLPGAAVSIYYLYLYLFKNIFFSRVHPAILAYPELQVQLVFLDVK
jgi:hypothetical protein